MALGYCMKCECLKSIKPGAQKWGSRECAWSPIEHTKRVHIGCLALVTVDEDTDAAACTKCGPIEASRICLIRCEGSGKEIR